MKTMLWKELRENMKWGILALLCLLTAEFYALSSERQSYSEDFRNLTLCSSAFLMVTSFGCSAIGVGLGVVQILPELRRDQWAALLHRPVSRSVILFGKIFAGMLLYFASTTLPFLVSVIYVAIPGQFASPLVPGMLIPGLSDLFIGLVFYFAAILLCLHQGRWFGSRGAIGLSVILIFILHMTGWGLFLLPIISSAIILLAAWGAMLSNGSMQNRPWRTRVALAFVVLLGVEAALLITIWGLQLLPSPKSPIGSQAYTTFRVALDGQIFFFSSRGDDGTNQVVTDMSGKVVTDPRYVGSKSGQNWSEMLPLAWAIGKVHSVRDTYLGGMPRDTWNYVRNYNDSQSKEAWYFLVKQNYFIGYDKLSRRPVGIYDADGFKPPGAVPKPFPLKVQDSIISFRNPHLFWSGIQLYGVDFAERSAVAFQSSSQAIYGAVSLTTNWLSEKPELTAVALENEIQLFDAQGKPLFKFAYPHDTHIWSSLSICTNEKGDRVYVQSSPSLYPYWGRSTLDSPNEPVFLDEIDRQGNILHTYSHPGETPVMTPESWVNSLIRVTSPALPMVVGTLYTHLFPRPEIALADYEEGHPLPKPVFQITDLQQTVPLLLGLILGLFTLLWARRNGFGERQARLWALFVFCFGLPALVTFRLVADWPTKVPCPQCESKRSIKKDECPNCHQPWPPPASTGIEIFDLEKISFN